jgi:GT2 family glycosyltransferase
MEKVISPLVSIIIVNYNTTVLTRQCIESVLKFTTLPFEIILVDNASKDRSIEQFQQFFPQLRLILNKENIGFGSANNLGISKAEGKYFFLLNSDTLLTSDAVGRFFSYMEQQSNKEVACCGGNLIKADGSDQISYGNFPSLAEAFSALGFLKFYQKYYLRRLSSGVINYSDEIRAVDYICGADMFIRRSAFSDVGGFDPEFFLYFEEVELAVRLQRLNYQLVIIPDVKIIHHESASVARSSSGIQKTIYLAQSRRLYFRKNHGMISAMLINKIYALQAVIFFCTKWRYYYLLTAKVLFKM